MRKRQQQQARRRQALQHAAELLLWQHRLLLAPRLWLRVRLFQVYTSYIAGLRLRILYLIYNLTATPQSHAWIAGPIVGSIAGLAFALGVSLYFWRRRQRRQAKPNDFDPLHDKAQLHSDCIPKPELDAYTNTIHELDAQPAPKRTEMPVNEVPTAELQTRDETESVAVNESDLMRDLGFVIASSTVSDTSTRSNAKAITRKPIQT